MIKNIFTSLKEKILFFLQKKDIKIEKVDLQKTLPHFDGDVTFVLFQIIPKQQKENFSKNNIDVKTLGEQLGRFLVEEGCIEAFNIIGCFLNMKLHENDVIKILDHISTDESFYTFAEKNTRITIEFSSPNTNKPLHLGHLRNIFLGYAVSKLMKKVGYNVKALTLVNDRGVHICKSMLAYMREGGQQTPDDAKIKGDHFVGDFYVLFEKLLQQQKKDLHLNDVMQAPLMNEVRGLLKKWEEGDENVVALWKKMNAWVLKGFEETYSRLGVTFDETNYESQTYLLGKEIIKEGLEKNIFYKGKDGSVAVDLSQFGLDTKVLLRDDGTSVYITQDLGTIDMRYKESPFEKMIYIVGDEQEYHFKVLKAIDTLLQKPYAEGIYHLSYGMIDLPCGKMKSREGTVVDADELIDEMVEKAKRKVKEIGKFKDILTTKDGNEMCEAIGLSALRFFLLKVDPHKRFTFDPNKSIDFCGDTGPFLLYANVRILSILEKIEEDKIENKLNFNTKITKIERDIILLMYEYREKINSAAEMYNPSVLATYAITLAKSFNRMYDELSILKEIDEDKKEIRIAIIKTVSRILTSIFDIFGIRTIKKM